MSDLLRTTSFTFPYIAAAVPPRTEKPFDGLSWLGSFLSHRCRFRRVKMVRFVCCLFVDLIKAAAGTTTTMAQNSNHVVDET